MPGIPSRIEKLPLFNSIFNLFKAKIISLEVVYKACPSALGTSGSVVLKRMFGKQCSLNASFLAKQLAVVYGDGTGRNG